MINNTNDSQEINIKSILLKYIQHWKWFILSIIFFFILAKIYLRYSQPLYSANAKILIKSDESSGNLSEMAAFEDLGVFSGGKNNIDNEIEILKSRSLIAKTIKEGKFNINYIYEGRIKSSDGYGNNPIYIEFEKDDKDLQVLDTIIKLKLLNKNSFEIINAENEVLYKTNFGQKNISKN